MSEADTLKILCRYFAHGACKAGAQCRFSHDYSNSRQESVCRYYLRGHCFYGSNCRYDHVRFDTNKNAPKNALKHESIEVNRQESPDLSSELSPGDSPKQSTRPGWTGISFASIVHSENEPTELEFCDNISSYKECAYDPCDFLHYIRCELCGMFCLHPTDEKQQKQHKDECLKELETNMAYSFAVQRSLMKTCGICLEVVMSKESDSEQRFGILENCSHVFCLTCIRQWRQNKSIESEVVKGCPICRVISSFVTPSVLWIENKEEKAQLMTEYKGAMRKQHCKYFKRGVGRCPFAGDCFYKHVDTMGNHVELGYPRKRKNQYGDVSDINNEFLWGFMSMRDIFDDDL